MELVIDREKLLKELDDFANFEIIFDLVQQINSYNGNLDHIGFMPNDEDFFETVFYNDPMEAVRATQFGDYNFMDDYILFNGYGNLDSYNDFEAMNEFREYRDDIVDNIYELYRVDEWVQKLTDELLK
jgi:hypothetical protein